MFETFRSSLFVASAQLPGAPGARPSRLTRPVPAGADAGSEVPAAAAAAQRHGLRQPRGQPAGAHRHGRGHQRGHRETPGLSAVLAPRPEPPASSPPRIPALGPVGPSPCSSWSLPPPPSAPSPLRTEPSPPALLGRNCVNGLRGFALGPTCTQPWDFSVAGAAEGPTGRPGHVLPSVPPGPRLRAASGNPGSAPHALPPPLLEFRAWRGGRRSRPQSPHALVCSLRPALLQGRRTPVLPV